MSPGDPFQSARQRAGASAADAARVYRSLASQPSWAVRLGATLAALCVLGILLVLLVPAIVIFLAVLGVGIVTEKIRRVIPGLSARRGGAIERERDTGRKNVRVVVRDPTL